MTTPHYGCVGTAIHKIPDSRAACIVAAAVWTAKWIIHTFHHNSVDLRDWTVECDINSWREVVDSRRLFSVVIAINGKTIGNGDIHAAFWPTWL